jgi:hypothetical protein
MRLRIPNERYHQDGGVVEPVGIKCRNKGDADRRLNTLPDL